MLSPLEPKEDVTPEFVVCDIECYAFPHPKEGQVIAIDTAWRSEKGIEHEKHGTWADWWSFIVEQAQDDKRFRVIYAHNGGGYDWVSFVEYSISASGKTERENVSITTAGSRMVTVSIRTKCGFSIVLSDSLQLLRSSLDKLSQVFLNEKKVDTGGKLPHEIYHSDPDLFACYHRNDTELLLRVMESAIEMVREKVCKIDTFGYTIGATALKVFRTMGLDRAISIPSCPLLKEFLREGYKGGRVECFHPGIYDSVTVYDINSLYPYAMKSIKVPVTDRGVWTTDYDAGQCGLYRIRFNQINRNVFPVLMKDGNGVYEGEGVYFTPEIDLLKKADPHCELEFLEGFIFLETDFIFSSFVDKLYRLRLEHPDSPISLLSKFLLNSLYGKFAQNAIREMIHVESEIGLSSLEEINISGDTGIRPINPRLGIFSKEHETRCNFEHVGIAGMITSFARVCLYKGMQHAGKEKVIYCDTDSVHIQGSEHSRIFPTSTGLGHFKKESTGRGVYIGKKLYGIRDSNKCEKVRVKGVSIGGNFGSRVTFDDLVRVCQGEPKRCEFKKFATPLEVMKEQAMAGSLRQRHRTIRRIK